MDIWAIVALIAFLAGIMGVEAWRGTKNGKGVEKALEDALKEQHDDARVRHVEAVQAIDDRVRDARTIALASRVRLLANRARRRIGDTSKPGGNGLD